MSALRCVCGHGIFEISVHLVRRAQFAPLLVIQRIQFSCVFEILNRFLRIAIFIR